MAQLPRSSAVVLPSDDDIELGATALAPAIFGEVDRLAGEARTIYRELATLRAFGVGSTINMNITHVNIFQSLLS